MYYVSEQLMDRYAKDKQRQIAEDVERARNSEIPFLNAIKNNMQRFFAERNNTPPSRKPGRLVRE